MSARKNLGSTFMCGGLAVERSIYPNLGHAQMTANKACVHLAILRPASATGKFPTFFERFFARRCSVIRSAKHSKSFKNVMVKEGIVIRLSSAETLILDEKYAES